MSRLSYIPIDTVILGLGSDLLNQGPITGIGYRVRITANFNAIIEALL